MEADNIVVTDMIPSGFEIENPRITDEREMTCIKINRHLIISISVMTVSISILLQAKQHAITITLRAVSTGSFIMGTVSADAMYNGEIHSYSGAGRVHIIK